METPAGELLTRDMAPELFRVLDGLRERLRTPPIHNVWLTPDFNAGVMQGPRLGFFGRHRTHLFVGLPLMKSLTVEQFQAVLAHELGHLSQGHARMPRFCSTPFPFVRAHEYEADAAAIELTSARSAAQALTAVSIVGSYLRRKYWPKIHSAARELPQPAFAPYSEFMATAIQDVPAEELRSWLETALATKTSRDDTHPSLADRLMAMGAEAEFAPPSAGNSADRLLGAECARLESVLDAQWRERVAESWRRVHENARTQAALIPVP